MGEQVRSDKPASLAERMTLLATLSRRTQEILCRSPDCIYQDDDSVFMRDTPASRSALVEMREEIMKSFCEILNESLKAENIGPARRALDGGWWTFRWHVDNCDDRFVDACFAERFAESNSNVVRLVMRDAGSIAGCRESEVVVRLSDLHHTVNDVMSWVYEALLHLARTSPQQSSREEAERIAAERGQGWRLPPIKSMAPSEEDGKK